MKKKKAQRSRSKKSNAGKDLLEQVVRLSGLPSRVIKQELIAILEKKKIDIHKLTLDELRTAVASYLREIIGGILEKHQRQETQH